MAHLIESTVDRRRLYSDRVVKYKVPRAVGYKVPRAVEAVDDRGKVPKRGAVNSRGDSFRSRSGTAYYEVPEYNEGWREERSIEQSENLSEDYIVCKPHSQQVVPSVVRPLRMQNKESVAANKRTAMLSSGVCKLLFILAVFVIVLIGIISLVLGALTMKQICHGNVSCSSKSVESEDVMMRQQLSSLQKRFQDLKQTALSTINSTRISAVVNTSVLYEGCQTIVRRCNVLPVTNDFQAVPRGPVCETLRVRINRDVSFIIFDAVFLLQAKYS